MKGNHEEIDYDNTSFEVKVDVSEGESSGFEVDIQYPENGIVFKNKYNASGSQQIKGQKSLIGKDWDDASFTFDLMVKDTVINSKTVDKDSENKEFVFDEITYTLNNQTNQIEASINNEIIATSSINKGVASFNYTVVENMPNGVDKDNTLNGLTYDNTKYEIEVKVKDNGNGTLDVSSDTDNNDIVFTNTYRANGSAVVEGLKITKGMDIQENAFAFELLDEYGNVIETVKNAQPTSKNKAPFTFSNIDFVLDENNIVATYANNTTESKEADAQFKYSVREVSSKKEDGIQYDQTIYHVTIKVVHDQLGNLNTEVVYEDGNIEFTNSYETKDSIQFRGNKKLNGKEWNSISKEDQEKLAGNTSFTLYQLEGNQYKEVETAVLGKDGTFKFASIEYTLTNKDSKTNTYKVVETKTNKGYEIDKTEYIYEVIVKDNGDGTNTIRVNNVESNGTISSTFNNKKTTTTTTSKKKKGVKTGIEQNMALYGGMMAIALLVLVLLRKRKMKD